MTAEHEAVTAAALVALPWWAGVTDHHGHLAWGGQPQLAAWLGCSQATVSRVWRGASGVQLVHLTGAADSRGQSLAELARDLERWRPGWDDTWEPCQDCRGRGRLDRVISGQDGPFLVWRSCPVCEGTGLEPRWTAARHPASGIGHPVSRPRRNGDGCQGRTSYGPHVWGPADSEGQRWCRVCGDAGGDSDVNRGQAEAS